MIEVVCVCKWPFEVGEEHAGRSIKCPRCRRLVHVPDTPVPVTKGDEPTLFLSEEKPVSPPVFPPSTAKPNDLRQSIEKLVNLNRSIKIQLAWIIGLLALILLRLVLRG